MVMIFRADSFDCDLMGRFFRRVQPAKATRDDDHPQMRDRGTFERIMR
jgi:hypothetical protein